MASFNTHLFIGGMVSSGFAVATIYSWQAQIHEAGAVLLAGLLGNALPDLDSDSGKPVGIAFKSLSYLAAALVLTYGWHSLELKACLLFAAAAWIFTNTVLKWSFCRLTTHRGLLHSTPIALLWSCALMHLMPTAFEPAKTLIGIACFLGFHTHLLLDECFSVNLGGLQIKRSFGTAFKVLPRPFLLSIGLYLLGFGILQRQALLWPWQSEFTEQRQHLQQNPFKRAQPYQNTPQRESMSAPTPTSTRPQGAPPSSTPNP